MLEGELLAARKVMTVGEYAKRWTKYGPQVHEDYPLWEEQGRIFKGVADKRTIEEMHRVVGEALRELYPGSKSFWRNPLRRNLSPVMVVSYIDFGNNGSKSAMHPGEVYLSPVKPGLTLGQFQDVAAEVIETMKTGNRTQVKLMAVEPLYE